MKTLKAFLSAAMLAALIYLTFVFGTTHFDIFQWDDRARWACGFLMLTMSGIVFSEIKVSSKAL